MAASPMSNRVALDINFITFYDEDVPPAGIVENKGKAFTLTTGGFPHEVVFSTECSTADISRIQLILQDAKDIVLEKCDKDSGEFQVIAERSLSRGASVSGGGAAGLYDFQKETFSLDQAGEGKGIRAIKVKILSGFSDFVGVGNVSVWGEESEKRVAVMESKPEVSM